MNATIKQPVGKHGGDFYPQIRGIFTDLFCVRWISVFRSQCSPIRHLPPALGLLFSVLRLPHLQFLIPNCSFLIPIFLLLFLSPSLSHSEDIVTPQTTTIDHYQSIWKRSPFTVSTAPAEDQSSGTWVITGLDADPLDPLVFLENKEDQSRITVTNELNKGFQVISIDPQPNFLDSSAVIRTPSQGDLKVKFDKDQIASSAPPPLPPGTTPPMPPGMPSSMPHQFTPPPQNIVHPIHHATIPSPPPR